jgi:perosamine synthetase
MIKQFLQPTKLAKSDYDYINQFIAQSEPQLPAEKECIKVCEPTLDKDELNYVTDCIKQGWISSMGNYVALFEQRFAEFVGVKHAVSVTNGTHALELALAALGVGPGDEVIVPTFTMIACSNAVRYLGATPVFVDARPDTWNIDETQVEAAITKKTKAIMVVHIYGHPVEMDTIMAIAEKHGIAVIEDAAEAHGALYKGRKIGSIGDIGCFSLYANKVITTGEGGLVVTNNDDIHHLLYKLHNHAFADTIHFWHEYLGYNFRMTNLQAAVGCGQMEKIQKLIDSRRRNAKLYMELLKDVPNIQFPVELPDMSNTYWMFGIVLNEKSVVTRDQMRQLLAEEGIETRTFFIPLHLQPIYYRPEYQGKFPVSERLSQFGFYLPSASHLSSEKIEFICSRIKKALVK